MIKKALALTEELYDKSWSRSDISLKAACFCSKCNPCSRNILRNKIQDFTYFWREAMIRFRSSSSRAESETGG